MRKHRTSSDGQGLSFSKEYHETIQGIIRAKDPLLPSVIIDRQPVVSWRLCFALGCCGLVMATAIILPFFVIGSNNNGDSTKQIMVGAVFATDNDSDSSRWAALLAQEHINEVLIAGGGAFTFNLSIGYDGADDDGTLALEFLSSFYDNGIRAVVGMTTSTTSSQVLPYAQSHSMVLLSPSSTESTLAVPGNHFFSMYSSNRIEARAIATLGNFASVAVVLAVNDSYGRDFVSCFQQEFNGSTNATSFYPPTTSSTLDGATDWSTYLEPLLSAITKLDSPVLMLCVCGSQEIGDILDAMQQMTWPTGNTYLFLTDMATSSPSVVVPGLLSFSTSLHISGVIPHIDTTNPLYQQLAAQWQSENRSGTVPPSALTAYDAVLLFSLAFEVSEQTEDFAQLNASLVNQASYFYGASGYAAFSRDGDRLLTIYDVYAINEQGWFINGSISPPNS